MKLFKHQQKGVELSRKGPKAFFWDCGTGKTLTALNIIKEHKAKGFGPALVVCPLSIIDAAWIEDCKKFTPELGIISLWSKKPQDRLQRLSVSADVFVCNYETFKSLWPAIQQKRFKVLIIDESSKMKCPTSQITRAILAMAGIKTRGKKGKTYPAVTPIPYRYVMSGTPAPNDKSEYWSQCKFITGPGNFVFNDNFYAFRSRYFYSKPLGRTGVNLWFFKPDMETEFKDAIAQVANVVAKEDCLDLPDQVHEVRQVRLSDPERKAYNQLKNELVLRFKDETVLASNALTEVMKLRQLSSGFCYGEEGTHVTGTSKLKELKALLEEIGDHQVIIWCNFKYEIQMLLDEFKGNSMALWSGTPDRDSAIKIFKDRGYQYLIANPQSAAHGLTFTNCNYAVYFSMNYSYELQKQSEDRIHRIGQHNKCTYYYLLAEQSVDKMIYDAVRRKGELSRNVLYYLKNVDDKVDMSKQVLDYLRNEKT